jgi:hypothetical protein
VKALTQVKKRRKATAGQKEMLLPIEGQRSAEKKRAPGGGRLDLAQTEPSSRFTPA